MNMYALWVPNQRGSECDATPLDDTGRRRVVACLNVWNDLGALKVAMRTWYDNVDKVIAVDGAYASTGRGLSDDGTREFLATFPKVELLDVPGRTQLDKRNAYMAACTEGDYLFVVDADEIVREAQLLRQLPRLDCGWLTIANTMYAREYRQPRVFRWVEGLHYAGRHHWCYVGDRVLATHQYGGPGFEHRTLSALTLQNKRSLGRDPKRIAVKAQHGAEQVRRERALVSMPGFSDASDEIIGAREALHILNVAYRDDGIAPSRFHTAINRTTPHTSLLFKQREGPFGAPTQFLTSKSATMLHACAASADVLHFHGVMSLARTVRNAAVTVFHHHGTLYRRNVKQYNANAVERNALVLVANLELLTYDDGSLPHGGAKFLPNAVPVVRYRALRRAHLDAGIHAPFRVAHSPSKRDRKGTDDFLTVIAQLQQRGVDVEAVLIENVNHSEALALKATCDACFDSFWLGMQCSGLECAAMGMPVIAGDTTVRDRYVSMFGQCPYTFADSRDNLYHELHAMIHDEEYRNYEAHRVSEYVRRNHDESAVALLYLNYLDDAFGWRAKPLPTVATQKAMTRRFA